MRGLSHLPSVPSLALVSILSLLGCKGFTRVFAPHPPPQPPPNAALDEPPPLHTGGLGVLSGQPPGGASHGSPVAGGIATGVGALVVGAGVVKTVQACSQPGASLTCLRGPGPAETADAGAP